MTRRPASAPGRSAACAIAAIRRILGGESAETIRNPNK
jgi:hypothetical protein